jgi:hypothetical protein
MRSRSDDDGINEFIDDQLSKIPARKEQWVNLYEDWTNLKENQLSDKKIADWYFQTIQINKKP